MRADGAGAKTAQAFTKRVVNDPAKCIAAGSRKARLCLSCLHINRLYC